MSADAPPLHGVLPVDKPVGPTSHDAVAAVRRALRTRQVGHTGTLDPFASGLLLVCVGPATRLASTCSRKCSMGSKVQACTDVSNARLRVA